MKVEKDLLSEMLWIKNNLGFILYLKYLYLNIGTSWINCINCYSYQFKDGVIRNYYAIQKKTVLLFFLDSMNKKKFNKNRRINLIVPS